MQFVNMSSTTTTSTTTMSMTLAPDEPCDINDGDTAFVVVGAVMILGMMTNLAFFTAGLLRSNNTLSILMAHISSMVVCSVLWLLFGYSLAFGTDHGGFIGGFDFAFFNNVGNFQCNPTYSTSIPHSAFAFFEMMFAIISPLLITGSYAERVGARTSLIFGVLWSILVYYPVAHWVWGGGWLKQKGVLDFAGGIVLHTTAGTAALVSAVFVGRRVGFELVHGEFPPSNLPLAALGVSGLWIGWFFFNGASALASNGIALSAALSTQIGAATCAIVYYIFSSIHLRNRPSFVAMMNGLVAGMAGITPASGYITTGATLGLGAVLGFTYWGAVLLKRKLHIDDALDVSIVHGLTGVIGSVAIGFVATTSEKAPVDGVFYGGEWSFFGWQCLAVLVCGAWSAVWTFLIWYVMNKVRRVRFDIVAETNGIGLDLHDHGEYAYHGLRLAGKEPLFESLLSELDGEASVKSPLLGAAHAAIPHVRSSSSGSSDDDDETAVGSAVAGGELQATVDQSSINNGQSFGDINQMSREQKKSLLLRLARSNRKNGPKNNGHNGGH